jgi:predicted nucleotide-binding protein (sugar kinase/HSP70/actin superfamily)
MKDGAAALFVPEIVRVDHGGRPFKLCVYSQQLASFVRVALDREAARRNMDILAPKIMLSTHRGGSTCEALERAFEGFHVSPGDVERAFDRGLAAYVEFKSRMSERGMEALRGADSLRPAVVLFGRPYSAHDPALNLQVVRRLERLGVTVIPYDTVAGGSREEECPTPWLLGDEQIRAARVLARFPHAYPLGITYYGCGVDAFLTKHLQDLVGRDRPFLVIELDGHGAEAGLETRLEAFVEQIRTRRSPLKGARISTHESAPTAATLSGKTMGIPYVAPHVHAFAAVFRRMGWDAHVLPEPDDEVRLLGERYSNGRECNPYFYLVGDLIQYARDTSLSPERKIFFIPTSSQSSCLISQYGKGFRAALEEAGVAGLTVWTPTGAELMDMLSLEEKRLLWIGLLGIDYVFRLSASISPYEKERGRTRDVFRLCLEEIREGMAAGDAAAAVRRAARMMEAVERSEPSSGDRRLRIGIIGDVYTRINHFANQSLYEVLESMGCEVLAPSFLVDMLLYDMAHDVRRKAQGGSLTGTAKRAAVSVYQWAVWNYVRSLFPLDPRILRDGDLIWGPGETWYTEASRYLNVETEGLLAQNIGKAVDHVRNGAEGIINVMCHGCMIGTSTEAVLGRVSESFESMPVLSLSYDSLGDVHTRTRLEAFIALCRAWKKRRGLEKGPQPGRTLSSFLS